MLKLSLHALNKEDISLEGSHVTLKSYYRSLDVPLTPTNKQFLSKLITRIEEDELYKISKETFGISEGFSLLYLKDFLIKQGLISLHLFSDDKEIFYLEPLSADIQLNIDGFNSNEEFRISPYAFIRALDQHYILESPITKFKIVILDNLFFSLFAKLSTYSDIEKLIQSLESLPQEFIQESINLLYMTGFLEIKASVLPKPLWEFHDLLFHSRSRLGMHSNPYGATYKGENSFQIPPIVKKMKGTKIPLPKVDIEALYRDDLPLTRVIEERKSIREPSEDPITLQQLGEFLYRCCRIKSVNASGRYPTCSKPYPSGGAMYELEIYLSIWKCNGLDSGFYHYDPEEHLLTLLCLGTENFSKPVGNIKDESLQIQFYLTSRISRFYWKYEGMAFSATLKNTGVLFQNMYLIATAMGLAPCALGGGAYQLPSSIFIDPLEEPVVGEFLLGSRRDL